MKRLGGSGSIVDGFLVTIMNFVSKVRMFMKLHVVMLEA